MKLNILIFCKYKLLYGFSKVIWRFSIKKEKKSRNFHNIHYFNAIRLSPARDCVNKKVYPVLCLFQACAHRYIYYVFMYRLDPVGVCYITRNNFSQFEKYLPCVEPGDSSIAYLRLILCFNARHVVRATSGSPGTINEGNPSVLVSPPKIV